MEAIPTEWIDKLFACMEQFYGERWTRLHAAPRMIDINKTMWRSGLVGLSYDQIKAQLQRYKRAAEDPRVQPPHVMEFFRFAKDSIDPVIDYHPKAGEKGDPEIAREHLNAIRGKLR